MHPLSQLPSHFVAQISETLGTYPTTVVLCDVSLCKHFRRTGFHEFSPTAFAMVVVPIVPGARVFLETQNGSTSPFRVIDTPITHSSAKLSCWRSACIVVANRRVWKSRFLQEQTENWRLENACVTPLLLIRKLPRSYAKGAECFASTGVSHYSYWCHLSCPFRQSFSSGHWTGRTTTVSAFASNYPAASTSGIEGIILATPWLSRPEPY